MVYVPLSRTGAPVLVSVTPVIVSPLHQAGFGERRAGEGRRLPVGLVVLLAVIVSGPV